MQKSSTYNEPSVFGSKHFTMLFILILNRVVERMLPCRTPCACSNWSDKVEPTRTCTQRSARKLLIKTGNLPFSPNSRAVYPSSIVSIFQIEKYSHNMFLFYKSISYKSFQSNQIVIGSTFRSKPD